MRSESKTLATITLQNYFRMYQKLSGMTGTAKTEEDEFRDIYNMDVVVIPTNKPIIREDLTGCGLCDGARQSSQVDRRCSGIGSRKQDSRCW